MVPVTLQVALLKIFNDMNSISKDGDVYCATEMAKAIKTFIFTGQVATTDTGAAPAGTYAGAGIGAMNINDGTLSDNLLKTFQAEYNNDNLADNIASDTDNACKEDSIIKTTSTGIVTTPSGATSPFSGPGEGEFTGVKNTIASTLKVCFSAMNNMTSGGNEYYAAQLALAVHSYLIAGAINITLKAPFTSGSGMGKII